MQAFDECVSYFKSAAGFSRLMDGLLDTFVRYERCFGAVRLMKPTQEEEKCVSEFFRRDYYNQALIRIGLADFERQVQKVFSEEIQLGTLLEAYFQKRIVRRTNARENMNAFSIYIENELLPKQTGKPAAGWLREILAHMRRSYRHWAEQYLSDPKKISDAMENLCGAVNEIILINKKNPAPSNAGSVSEFSLKHTGSARALDISGEYGPLFIRALAWMADAPYPAASEDAIALYLQAGLLADGVMSQATARGLVGFTNEKQDEVCAAYNKKREAAVWTLENLNNFSKIKPFGEKVFVTENLAVFSAVNERTCDLDRTLVCAANGLNPALTMLLDKLCASGARVYYSCDMDYQGLCVADKIYLRYPRQFVPWRLSKADYEKIISDSDFYMTDKQKELGLHNEELASLLSAMRKAGKTALQSALVEELASDVINL